MTDYSKLYKEMNSTFMGHGIDGIIIQPQFEYSDNDKLRNKAWREYALDQLETEAKLCLEVMKDD